MRVATCPIQARGPVALVSCALREKRTVMKTSLKQIGLGIGILTLIVSVSTRAFAASAPDSLGGPPGKLKNDSAVANGAQMIAQGREIFRYNTFGDEAFWSGTLGLNLTIAGADNGGIGPGLSPATALGLGLKVDVNALPQQLQQRIKRGQINLNDPAITLALLRLNAVVGVRTVAASNSVPVIGITCALCHSTVDDSFAPGIGRRLDGWPNRDLNVGAIINFSADLSAFVNALQVSEATVRTVLTNWGPGRFDAALLLDGQGFRTNDGKTAATVIPAAFGLAGVNLHTYTGWGSVPHWNAFVANLEMQGVGRFYDPRLNDTNTFPVAARLGFANVTNAVDLITSNLPALHLYQLAIPVPEPPAGSFDPVAASEGRTLFNGKANCASCHTPPIFTDPGWNMHTPEEIGIDAFQANRSPDKHYRTTPLGGLFTRTKGGFYHDGRFATLLDVVNHYDAHFTLGLSVAEKNDLVEYLKSL